MKIKMKVDEIIISPAGPVRLFAGVEYDEKEIGAVAIGSLLGRDFADVVEEKMVEKKLTPAQKAALTRSAKKAKKEAEEAEAKAGDEAVKGRVE